MAPRPRHHPIAARAAAAPLSAAPLRWIAAGRVALALALTLLAAGCTIPEAKVGFDGTLEVFGPDATFPEGAIPDDWAADGISTGRLAHDFVRVATERSTPVLTLTPADRAYILARRTNAYLLASPFLRWSWNMAPIGRNEHPTRLAVGFYGGAPESVSRGGRPFVYLGNPLPPYDRVLALVWGASALERGFTDTKQRTVRYVVRGGGENAGRWWTDTVDLSQLYRRAWPKDDPTRARIAFIGFAVSAGDAAQRAKFADIVLSR